jgi:hypothetical protein
MWRDSSKGPPGAVRITRIVASAFAWFLNSHPYDAPDSIVSRAVIDGRVARNDAAFSTS